VKVFQDPRVEETYPGLLSGSLKVSLHNGKSYESFQKVPKGDPENFVTDEDLHHKFSSLVRPCLGQGGESKLYDVIAGLETRSASDLFAATMPNGSRH
jgi:2-methylcitrate dehydratase PrpD